jgi:hypothetical protein
MLRRSERGEGQVGTLILLIVVAAIGLAAWNVIPVYYDHYDFTDAVEEICRTPRYKARTEKAIVDMLMKEVGARRLGEWIGPESFEVTTDERGRMIDLYYEREFTVLPGWKMTKEFEYVADQPLL